MKKFVVAIVLVIALQMEEGFAKDKDMCQCQGQLKKLEKKLKAKMEAMELRLKYFPLEELKDGWFLAQNDYQYKLFEDNLPFSGAKSACGIYGGNLASKGMRTARVRHAIISNMIEPTDRHAWIGLEKIGESWKWVDDVYADGLTQWNSIRGEPNDAGGIEDCAHVSTDLWHFNDTPCKDFINYVCERPNGKYQNN